MSVTFSLEVVAMQLTPDFRMASLELKPAETAVAVRVADGGELGMLVQTGFRMGPAQLSAADPAFPHAATARAIPPVQTLSW